MFKQKSIDIQRILLLLALLTGLSSFFKEPDTILLQEYESTTSAHPNADTSYLEIKAISGDNITRMLDRYALYEHLCNYDKFLSINKLPKNKYLYVGRKYKLPIQVIHYNGKSIRTTLGIEDIEQALRIQSYNDNARKNGLRSDDFRKTRDLWLPHHELACPPQGEEAKVIEDPGTNTETVQSSSTKSALGNRLFPIFGKKYEKTPLHDRRLQNRIFYVVSGHGGPDVGAQSKRKGHTLCEDEYAYDVALRLTRFLVSHGATAYMIVRDSTDGIRDDELLDCDFDEFVWGDKGIPRSQKARLQERCDIINELTEKNAKKGVTDQTFIEIHVDSQSKQSRSDVYFYYRSKSEESKTLAEKIHKTFLLQYAKVRANRRYEGSVTTRDLHMLRETTTPKAVYVELANIRNPYDQLRLVLPRNRELLAKWLCESFL